MRIEGEHKIKVKVLAKQFIDVSLDSILNYLLTLVDSTDAYFMFNLRILNFQIQDRAQEIEKLLSFVNQLFLPEKGASVIVDNSEVSKGILAQIVRKFTSTGREILGQHILEKSPEEESVLELNLMMSSLLFIDLDPKKSQEVINMIESLGLIAFHENLWISMTKRATGNIKNMCNKPTHYYNYAEQKSTPLGSAYIVEKVAGCRRTGVTMEEIQCSRYCFHILINPYAYNSEYKFFKCDMELYLLLTTLWHSTINMKSLSKWRKNYEFPNVRLCISNT